MSRFLVLALLLACDGAISDTGPEGPAIPPPPVIDETSVPDVGWAPSALLTSAQYAYSVFDLLGVRPSAELPAENRSDAFVDNAFQHEATLLSEDVRATIVETAVLSIDEATLLARVGCSESCNADDLQPFLRRAFRRNIPIEEREALALLVDESASLIEGVRLLVEVVLLSPQFLYRFEAPMGESNDAGFYEADAFTLASRLSFFLWSSGPDDVLLDLAQSGELNSALVVEEQVARMMDDARFERTIEQFHEQWLELHPIENLDKVGEDFAEFADAGPAWRSSFDAFVIQTFDGGLRELLTTPDLVLTPELAAAYGFEPQEEALATYSFDPAERAGLLTHPALMAKLAYADQDSPIFRGVFVMRRFLCREPPAPPADVDLTPPVVDPESTSRERFDTLTGSEPCIGCHAQFNPIGYLFSHYDAAGRFVTESSTGRALDATATLTFLGDDIDGEYADATELAEALADSETVHDCIAGHWLRYALGRPVTRRDTRSIYEARVGFRESGDFRRLMQTIATGPGFRLYRAEEGDE